jgi:hypothetical protein
VCDRSEENRFKYEDSRRMVSPGLLRSVALVRTDVSEDPGASFIRVTKIGALATTQAATSNRRTSVRRLLVAACRELSIKNCHEL